MMHFGGDKSDFHHLWGDFLVVLTCLWTPMGVLQPEAEEAILDLATAHIEKAARQ